jgi:ferric enterobactin receptor
MFGEDLKISSIFNKAELKEALQKLSVDYQASIIYPSDISIHTISIECKNCELDSLLSLLLLKTTYDWEKINNQYIIFEIEKKTYSLSGKIYDYKSNETIPFANVYIPSLNIGSISDDQGIFSLTNIDSKSCSLFVSYIGYETEKKSIHLKKTKNNVLEIYLKQKILNSKNIYIRGKSREFLNIATEPGKISFSPKHISTLPIIGEVDIFRSLQLLPGISQGLAGKAELYIRGARPDQNLLLIDGMPLYQETHMFGFVSSAQAQAIKDVQVYKGVYPAKYGGRTSGLIQISNHSGNTLKPSAKVFTNFTTNSAQIQLPVYSNGSLALSGRSSNNIVQTKLYKSIKDYIVGDDNFNLISLSANENQSTKYSPKFFFTDFNAVASHIINSKNRISFTIKHGKDVIKERREFYGFENILEFKSTKIIENTNLSNIGGIFKWTSYINPEWTIRSYYTDTHYFSNHDSKLFNNFSDNDTFSQRNYEKNTFSNQLFKTYHNIKSIQNHDLEFGFSKSILNTEFLTERFLNNASEKTYLKQNAILQSLFFEDKWSVAKSLILQLGLRNTYYSLTKLNYLEPRLSGILKINSNLSIEGAAGRNNQFTHQFNSPLSTRGTKGMWIIANDPIPVVASTSSQISAHWKSIKHELNLSFYDRKGSGYFDFKRHLSPITIISKQNNYINNVISRNEGLEKTNGAEIFIRRKNQAINGWVTYQINNTKYSFPDIDDGKYYSAGHNIEHEFKSVFITSILDWNVTTNWSYSSGRLYTDENDVYITNDFQVLFNPGTRNNKRLRPIHHLDFSVSKNFEVSQFQVNAGLSIYNVFNKKNISHKRYNPYASGKIISDVVMLGTTPTFFIEISI